MTGRLSAAVLALLALVAPSAAWAQPHWNQLSPRERREAIHNYQHFQRLQPDERRDVERNYQRWQTLPNDEKERARSNYRRYRDLSPEERRRIDEESQDWGGR
jgi:hypothetical protein